MRQQPVHPGVGRESLAVQQLQRHVEQRVQDRVAHQDRQQLAGEVLVLDHRAARGGGDKILLLCKNRVGQNNNHCVFVVFFGIFLYFINM